MSSRSLASRRRQLHPLLALGLLATSCLGECNPEDASDPATATCRAFSGVISGDPKLEMGSGYNTFVPVENGGRWLAGFGQQGGAHLWLSMRTQGVGPRVQVTYRMEEPDGRLITEGGPSHLCLNAGSGGQEALGVLAFIPDPYPEGCSRILCGGPFVFSMTLTDTDGHSLTDKRDVSGVDVGESNSDRAPPPCNDAGPPADCPATDAGP
ncbi:MAG: hypothetical protein AB2A00_40105 [Myxococcota bacterium]